MHRIVRHIVQNGAVWLGALVVVNIAFVGWGLSVDQADSPAARPQRSSIGPSLRLLAEIPPDEIKRLAEPQAELPLTVSTDAVVVTPESEALADQAPMQIVCRTWGPFKSLDELEAVASDVVAAGGETRVTQSKVSQRSDYLVYIGELGKARNARKILQDLRSHEIDSALIRKGRFNNTLSVGVFSRNDRAQRQQSRVAKLGYEAGIEEIDHSYDVFHLEARLQADFEPAVAPNGPCSDIAQAN